jgi:hypothetical protein
MHNSTALNKSLVFIDSQVLINHVHLLVNGKNPCQILMFIDSQVANADKPNESVAPGVEEMFFDATKDQVTPITEAPTQYTDVSSIHLVSHGQAVSFLLEPTQLKQ